MIVKKINKKNKKMGKMMKRKKNILMVGHLLKECQKKKEKIQLNKRRDRRDQKK